MADMSTEKFIDCLVIEDLDEAASSAVCDRSVVAYLGENDTECSSQKAATSLGASCAT